MNVPGEVGDEDQGDVQGCQNETGRAFAADFDEVERAASSGRATLGNARAQPDVPARHGRHRGGFAGLPIAAGCYPILDTCAGTGRCSRPAYGWGHRPSPMVFSPSI